jgi:hypothetical protein
MRRVRQDHRELELRLGASISVHRLSGYGDPNDNHSKRSRDSNQIARSELTAQLSASPGLTSGLPRVVEGLFPDCGRIAGLDRVGTGAYSSDVRAATNFRGAEKSRVWLGGRYSMARWRNGSSQGFHNGA